MNTIAQNEAKLSEEIRELSAEFDSVFSYKDEESTPDQVDQLSSKLMADAWDGFWFWDIPNKKAFFSERWKNILGYEDDELENSPSTWLKLAHQDDRIEALRLALNYDFKGKDPININVRMRHKNGSELVMTSRVLMAGRGESGQVTRMAGIHIDVTEHQNKQAFDRKNASILEMIARGQPASKIYDAIALMYEERHPGLRCSLLELDGNKLMHGGAPSMPKEYCEAINGLENGPNVGSCGTSTYTGRQVLVENIDSDPKWAEIKHHALPHGLRSCWSEPIKSSTGEVLGAFGMYFNHPALPTDTQAADLHSAASLASIIMERDHSQKRIHQMAFTDPLTGLSSRAHFQLNLEKLITASAQHDRRFSLLYIDLDNFKDVNDSLGHHFGDQMLATIAERLASLSDDVNFIARLGGDEFCVLIENDEHAVADIAQRCITLVSEPIFLSARKLIPSCSIGIAHYPDDAKDGATLLKAADTSLYDAKERGKGRYAFYKLELTEKAEYRFQVEQFLRDAQENNEFSLVYQPQFSLKDGKLTGIEALCRWHHPVLGEVPPNDFIPTAERIGMIRSLTEWVLRTACSQAVLWKKAGAKPFKIAINISPCLLLDSDLVTLISDVLKTTGLPATDLELEITESLILADPLNQSTLTQLQELGISFALDDFGTGYSSFASIKHLKFDRLKIDRHFIHDMLIDEESKMLVKSMIEMGHSLKHEIVAEGVETPEQSEILAAFGCATVQGFLFAKPIDDDATSTLLGAVSEDSRQ